MVERSKSLLVILAATAALGTSACQKDDAASEADAGPSAGGSGGGGTPAPGGSGGDGVVGGTPSNNGGDEPPVGGTNDGGTPSAGGAGGEGGPVGGSGAGGESGGGTLPAGSECDPTDDQCVSDSVCADIGFGKGPLCYATCDSLGDPTGCAQDEHCAETEECAQDAESCAGICIPSDGCSPCNAEQTCGGPASCFVGSLDPASLCLTAGTVEVGGDCLNGDVDQLLPEANCMEGLSCQFNKCVAPCGGAMCGEADNTTCGEGEVCADFAFKLNGTDYDFCTQNCSVGGQTGCGDGEVCIPADNAQVGDDIVWLNVCGEGTAGDKIQNDTCTPNDNYFGNCTGAYLCADLFRTGADTCSGFCDLQDQTACVDDSVCITEVLVIEGVGLCIGNCDVFGDGTECGDGNKCAVFNSGITTDGEKLAGNCGPQLEGAVKQTGEDCTLDEETGADDCGPGHLCIPVAQGEPRVCISVCDNAEGSEHTCPAGFNCMAGIFGPDSTPSERFGLCAPAN